jgi:hypothetical protein
MFAWFIAFVGGLVLFGFPYAGPALVAAYLYYGTRKWYVRSPRSVRLGHSLWRVQLFLGLPLFEGLVFQWIFG